MIQENIVSAEILDIGEANHPRLKAQALAVVPLQSKNDNNTHVTYVQQKQLVALVANHPWPLPQAVAVV